MINPSTIFATTFFGSLVTISLIKSIRYANRMTAISKGSALNTVSLYKELVSEKSKYFLPNDLEEIEKFKAEETKIFEELKNMEDERMDEIEKIKAEIEELPASLFDPLGIHRSARDLQLNSISRHEKLKNKFIFVTKRLESTSQKLQLMAIAVKNIPNEITSTLEYQNRVTDSVEKDLLILEKKKEGGMQDIFSIILMEAFVHTLHNNSVEARFNKIKDRLAPEQED